MANLGMRVKGLRESRRWTQQDLADLLGVARVTIARIEVGIRYPSMVMMIRLAMALDVKVRDLLDLPYAPRSRRMRQ